jgi:hypothetical protein
MIVAETDGAYRFVTQPDHAALAGQFADRWGNERFERPRPRSGVLAAAHLHDDGWWAYDRRPHLHGDDDDGDDGDGRPVGFTTVPPETWVDLYDEGIRRVVDVDPYAGLLVSMHGAGLRRRRYGLSPSWSDTPPDFAAFVDRQETLQSRLLADLRGTGDGDEVRAGGDVGVSASTRALLERLHESGAPGGESDDRLWTNYVLLQAWDALSLAFCTSTSPPAFDEVAPVPTGRGEDATLSVTRVARGEFRVEPYPFDASPLVVSVPARTVRRDAFEDQPGLARAYYAAGRATETFTLRRGDDTEST